MECEQITNTHAYHDGELSPEARQRVERHLAECEVCRDELESIQRLSRSFTELPRPALSPKALKQTHVRLADAVAERDAPVLRLALTFTTLAASLVILASVWLAPKEPDRNASIVVAAAPAADWERLALTLQPDRVSFDLPGRDTTIMLADASNNDARVADWMLRSLSP